MAFVHINCAYRVGGLCRPKSMDCSYMTAHSPLIYLSCHYNRCKQLMGMGCKLVMVIACIVSYMNIVWCP